MTSRILRSIFGVALMMLGLHSHADDATTRFRHIVLLVDSLSDQGNLLAATTVLGPQFEEGNARTCDGRRLVAQFESSAQARVPLTING